VRENQVAIFFRDGRALDMLGPGRHTLTTMNIPLLVSYLRIPFGGKSPFRAEVVFVNLKDYLDLSWTADRPLPYRDEEFGMVRLETRGKFAFQVARPQLFVNQIVGTQGLYATKDIVGFLQSVLISRLADLLGEIQTSLLDLPAHYDELGAGLRARSSEDFERLGLLLKGVYVTAIAIPPEVEKAIDERASMGAIGNMQAYMQFKTARALGDAARSGAGEGGSFAGMGVGLGAGIGLGTAMASAIGQATSPGQPQAAAPVGPAAQGAGLVEAFAALKQLVNQQLNLSAEEKEAATSALDTLLIELTSAQGTIADVRAARDGVAARWPWLAEPVRTLLNTPPALQMLGKIAARSL
jgi:membrane protease subunit (stomatin/prohibitin family)